MSTGAITKHNASRPETALLHVNNTSTTRQRNTLPVKKYNGSWGSCSLLTFRENPNVVAKRSVSHKEVLSLLANQRADLSMFNLEKVA
jgi:hypothetical protein